MSRQMTVARRPSEAISEGIGEDPSTVRINGTMVYAVLSRGLSPERWERIKQQVRSSKPMEMVRPSKPMEMAEKWTMEGMNILEIAKERGSETTSVSSGLDRFCRALSKNPGVVEIIREEMRETGIPRVNRGPGKGATAGQIAQWYKAPGLMEEARAAQREAQRKKQREAWRRESGLLDNETITALLSAIPDEDWKRLKVFMPATRLGSKLRDAAEKFFRENKAEKPVVRTAFTLRLEASNVRIALLSELPERLSRNPESEKLLRECLSRTEGASESSENNLRQERKLMSIDLMREMRRRRVDIAAKRGGLSQEERADEIAAKGARERRRLKLDL